MGFNHSVKVPSQYKRAAKILQKAITEKKSVRSLVFEEKHKVRSCQAILKAYSANRCSVELLIEKSEILQENPRLDPSLCRLLIAELVFGSKKINSEAKPITVVKSFEKKFQQILNSEGTDLVQVGAAKSQLISHKPRYVRINTNLVTPAEVYEFLEQEQFVRLDTAFENYEEYLEAAKTLKDHEYITDMHVDNLLVFCHTSKSYFDRHEWVQARKLLLQDKATCLVAELLQPPPNSIVLDMCAAPGMKTIHTSNIMKNQGTIYAIERDEKRYDILCSMVSNANATICKPVVADALEIRDEDCPGVEYIIVDPSCSGSGMQNRLSVTGEDEEKDSDRLYKLAGLQIKILRHALKNFPNVKRVIYSTCSLYEEENEEVVQKCLMQCPNFKLLSAKKSLRNKWKNTGDRKFEGVGKNCLYAKPEEDLSDGIFIAIFERKPEKPFE